MTGREQILLLANLYGSALSLDRTTVSWRLFKDTNKLDAIVAGRDLFLGRYERAMLWFSDHWPDPDVNWPADISRPAKSAVSPKVIQSEFVEAAP